MRLPKFGFNSAKARITAEVTLSELNNLSVDVVDLQALKDADVVQEGKLRAKVMLSGEIGRAITLKGIGSTKGARAAIEAAGGKIEE
jgi:large subunit ribosomal protein L15